MTEKLHIAGWGSESPSPAQLKEFFAQIESGRITGEKLQTLLTGGRKEFSMTINYHRPLKTMINAGKYDWSNDDITADHFPVEGLGKQEKSFTLFHFDRSIFSEEAIVKMDKERFSPAKIEDLLALGESQPELQKEFPVIALGSVWHGADGGLCVSCLGWSGAERDLFLGCFARSWSPCCRFLAVRK